MFDPVCANLSGGKVDECVKEGACQLHCAPILSQTLPVDQTLRVTQRREGLEMIPEV